jgi:1-acyl-sn-glycerol-3-phosphate acyltransferase
VQHSTHTAPEKFIDVKQIIASKNAGLAKWLPSFVLSYFKRIIHQDELNALMEHVGNKTGLAFIEEGLEFLNTKVEVSGLENIPKEKGVIIASNHPLGGLDGIALMHAVGKVRPDIQFLVNDILLNIESLQELFIPVNKVGANPRDALKVIEQAYAKEVAVLVFPAGLVSRKLPEGIADLEWQKSFLSKSIKYKKDIVPVHIGGRNSNFFYNLSNLRRKLAVKTNIEMFYLVDEMFKQKNKSIKIIFGKPITWQSFTNDKNLKDWAKEVRGKVYQLPEN